VSGSSNSPSTSLLAAWLGLRLQVNVEVDVDDGNASLGIHRVVLSRQSGDIRLERTEVDIAVLAQPGQPEHELSLPRRGLRECLAEELRRLDPDDEFGAVLRHGFGVGAGAGVGVGAGAGLDVGSSAIYGSAG
jgi:glucose-6-phosphate dehydrogenase assembly protein OpcA